MMTEDAIVEQLRHSNTEFRELKRRTIAWILN